jgi:hypothetical protein
MVENPPKLWVAGEGEGLLDERGKAILGGVRGAFLLASERPEDAIAGRNIPRFKGEIKDACQEAKAVSKMIGQEYRREGSEEFPIAPSSRSERSDNDRESIDNVHSCPEGSEQGERSVSHPVCEKQGG